MTKYTPRRRYSQVGRLFNMSSDDSEACGLFDFGVFKPSCWAAAYEREQYGTVPRITSAPTPEAPQTQDEMTTPGSWTPDDAIRNDIADWSARVRGQMAADAASGKWNPAGNLPVSASSVYDLTQGQGPLLILAAAVVILILISMVKR
jgi:hypothetical protein